MRARGRARRDDGRRPGRGAGPRGHAVPQGARARGLARGGGAADGPSLRTVAARRLPDAVPRRRGASRRALRPAPGGAGPRPPAAAPLPTRCARRCAPRARPSPDDAAAGGAAAAFDLAARAHRLRDRGRALHPGRRRPPSSSGCTGSPAPAGTTRRPPWPARRARASSASATWRRIPGRAPWWPASSRACRRRDNGPASRSFPRGCATCRRSRRGRASASGCPREATMSLEPDDEGTGRIVAGRQPARLRAAHPDGGDAGDEERSARRASRATATTRS